MKFVTVFLELNLALTFLQAGLCSFILLISIVIPDSHLGKISDYFHHNNKNNQLERRV